MRVGHSLETDIRRTNLKNDGGKTVKWWPLYIREKLPSSPKSTHLWLSPLRRVSTRRKYQLQPQDRRNMNMLPKKALHSICKATWSNYATQFSKKKSTLNLHVRTFRLEFQAPATQPSFHRSLIRTRGHYTISWSEIIIIFSDPFARKVKFGIILLITPSWAWTRDC